MPRTFDITTPTPALSLDGQGQAEVAFTVSNALGQPTRVRAVVEPSGSTKPEWLSLPEGAEKDLPPDGTSLFTVKLAVPPGTPPGQYSFNLLVVGVANPDEHYARGPGVAFTVAKAEVPVKKPFPWWLVALVGGVVLLAGGVVAVLASRGGGEPPGLEQKCAEKGTPCAPGLACSPAGTCLGPVGFKPCEKGTACLTGRCAEGSCQERVSLGDACTTAEDCREPLACHQSVCLVPEGQRCTHPSQCATGNCSGQVCQPAPVVECNPRCTRGSVCQGGQCVPLRIIIRDHRIFERVPIQPIPAPGP